MLPMCWPRLEKQRAESVDNCLTRWGRFEPTSLCLRDLYDMGSCSARHMELQTLVQRELCIRLTHAVAMLQSLPFGLSRRSGIKEAIALHLITIGKLQRCRSEDVAFVLEDELRSHAHVVRLVLSEMRTLEAELGSQSYKVIRPELDELMGGFLSMRIGCRFLMKHVQRCSPNGCAKMLKAACDVAAVARAAGADAESLCRASLMQAPPVLVSGAETLLYAPEVLRYTLLEVLKNACRAVVERHAEGFDDYLPPVHCGVERDERDVIVTIRDEGCGISPERLSKVWALTFSTSSKSAWRSADAGNGLGSAPSPGREQPVLSGYGIGLPLSRLYARYFGGGLTLTSTEGRGTDVRLKLEHSATRMERLPRSPISNLAEM